MALVVESISKAYRNHENQISIKQVSTILTKVAGASFSIPFSLKSIQDQMHNINNSKPFLKLHELQNFVPLSAFTGVFFSFFIYFSEFIFGSLNLM